MRNTKLGLNCDNLRPAERSGQIVGASVASICYVFLHTLIMSSPLVLIIVFIATAITKYNYQQSCYLLFNQLMEQRGLDYYQTVRIWRAEHVDAPFPNEFGGWYVAGSALASAFSAILIMIVVGIITFLVMHAAAYLTPSPKQKL